MKDLWNRMDTLTKVWACSLLGSLLLPVIIPGAAGAVLGALSSGVCWTAGGASIGRMIGQGSKNAATIGAVIGAAIGFGPLMKAVAQPQPSAFFNTTSTVSFNAAAADKPYANDAKTLVLTPKDFAPKIK